MRRTNLTQHSTFLNTIRRRQGHTISRNRTTKRQFTNQTRTNRRPLSVLNNNLRAILDTRPTSFLRNRKHNRRHLTQASSRLTLINISLSRRRQITSNSIRTPTLTSNMTNRTFITTRRPTIRVRRITNLHTLQTSTISSNNMLTLKRRTSILTIKLINSQRTGANNSNTRNQLIRTTRQRTRRIRLFTHNNRRRVTLILN